MAGHEIGTDLFDKGLGYLKTMATPGTNLVLHLTEGWLKGDNYTTITTTKSRGSYVLQDADVSAPGTVGEDRRVTISEVTIPGGSVSSTTGDLHIAVVDSTNSAMLFVTDETSNQAITAGNPVIVPTFTVGFNQLT